MFRSCLKSSSVGEGRGRAAEKVYTMIPRHYGGVIVFTLWYVGHWGTKVAV